MYSLIAADGCSLSESFIVRNVRDRTLASYILPTTTVAQDWLASRRLFKQGREVAMPHRLGGKVCQDVASGRNRGQPQKPMIRKVAALEH